MNHSKFRNIIRIFRYSVLGAAAAVAAAVTGCSEETFEIEQPQGPESGYITLSLQCIEGTRAPEDYTEDSDEEFNENLISSVTLCLWSKGGDKPDDTATPDYVQTFANLDKKQTVEIRVPITTVLRNKLFETAGAECHAFAAVNVDISALGDNFTIAELRNMAISSEFSSRRRQPSFAMDGDCVVKYDPTLNLAEGSIDLQRSASKITLALDVDETIEQSVVINGTLVNSKWKANTAEMRVSLVSGLAESTLDPNLDDAPKKAAFFDTPDNLVYQFVNPNSDNGNNPPAGKNYNYIQDRPFYTYPHRWSAEPGDYAATYMILSIPWRAVDENGEFIETAPWRTCYYQVPVIAADSDPLQLVRNVSYHVYLHVAMLGSFVPEEPLEIEDELKYSAAPWGTVNMDVEIPDVRYLVVDQNDYTVNNETSISIPFYTSHETIVTDATMTFYRYNYDDVGRELPVVVTKAKNEESAKANRAGAPVFTADFNNETKELRVSHDLVMYEGLTSANAVVSFTYNDGPNQTTKRSPRTRAQWNSLMNTIAYFKQVQPTGTMTDVNEYSRVEFKITLQHKDMQGTPNFQEIITITQYPGMYITTVPNYCEDNKTTFSYTGAEGNTFVNGNSSSRSNTQNYPSGNSTEGWMTSIGLSTGNYNFNPNMYLVTITTLPEGTPYRIGDPRSTDINNNLGSNKSYTNNFTGTLRTLTMGVNGPILTGENKNAWTGETYTWSGGSVNVVGFSQQRSIYPTLNARRTLAYYYPTYEDDAHKMMVAPKFRICSSYAGTTWILNRELSRRRAASYQELGYAAGRWRLPTFGEVAFVMQLAADFKIPRLFGANTQTWYYWCANGLVCVPAKNASYTLPTLPGEANFIVPTYTNPDVQRSRFVYDEWYWGDADLEHTGTIGSDDCVYTFTWGDKPFTTSNN